MPRGSKASPGAGLGYPESLRSIGESPRLQATPPSSLLPSPNFTEVEFPVEKRVERPNTGAE